MPTDVECGRSGQGPQGRPLGAKCESDCMGPLAVGLGREFTAEALYVLFTSCDLITTKKPNQSGATSPHGPALGGQWQP